MDSKTITSGFERALKWLQESSVSVTSKTGREHVKLPAIFALVIIVIIPFIILGAVLANVAFGMNFAIVRDNKEDKKGNDILRIN